ncbi:serine/threonine-protein phosphatase [Candidatus Acetothermia bacterium]|nr:serine/threonine-protein phosphatase [Candidatus Acetothermia bacterium]
MTLHLDIATKHLNKFKEELCGDSVEIANSDDSMIVVLSDGLGSGVKANILSSLTTKMAATMLRGGLPLNEVINTLAATLPVCEARRLAYSTFSILQIFNDGMAYLVECDSPESYIGHRRKLRYVHRKEKEVSGRVIKEAFFPIKEGDWIVLLSDGLLHAGIGGVWNLSWGAARIGKFLESIMETDDDAHSIAEEFIGTSNHLYASKPGDDGTCVIVKIREKRVLSMLVGPPINKDDDTAVVQKFFSALGKKVVCGGTTANIVVRILGKTLSVNLQSNWSEPLMLDTSG